MQNQQKKNGNKIEKITELIFPLSLIAAGKDPRG